MNIMDISMEQEKGLSVSEYERSLGISVLKLYQRLANFSSNLETIDNAYAAKKDDLERNYERAKSDANKWHENALLSAKSQYDSNVKSATETYESRKKDVEDQYYAKKKGQLQDSQSFRERNEARIKDLINLENDWRTYIDKVHLAFNKAVDQTKKDRTESIRKEYELLRYHMNQKALGEKGKVSYDRESPFLYALRHPYKEEPIALNGIRTVALIIAILCLIVIVGVCIWDAYHYRDIFEAYASGIVRFLLFGVFGYLVVEFIWCYYSTFAWVQSENSFKKRQREEVNDYILKEKADAAVRMLNFQKKYKSIYFVNGQWDFDWRRYPMKREEADVILNNTISSNRSTMPRTSDGILPYSFEINYNALNPLS